MSLNNWSDPYYSSPFFPTYNLDYGGSPVVAIQNPNATLQEKAHKLLQVSLSWFPGFCVRQVVTDGVTVEQWMLQFLQTVDPTVLDGLVEKYGPRIKLLAGRDARILVQVQDTPGQQTDNVVQLKLQLFEQDCMLHPHNYIYDLLVQQLTQVEIRITNVEHSARTAMQGDCPVIKLRKRKREALTPLENPRKRQRRQENQLEVTPRDMESTIQVKPGVEAGKVVEKTKAAGSSSSEAGDGELDGNTDRLVQVDLTKDDSISSSSGSSGSSSSGSSGSSSSGSSGSSSSGSSGSSSSGSSGSSSSSGSTGSSSSSSSGSSKGSPSDSSKAVDALSSHIGGIMQKSRKQPKVTISKDNIDEIGSMSKSSISVSSPASGGEVDDKDETQQLAPTNHDNDNDSSRAKDQVNPSELPMPVAESHENEQASAVNHTKIGGVDERGQTLQSSESRVLALANSTTNQLKDTHMLETEGLDDSSSTSSSSSSSSTSSSTSSSSSSSSSSSTTDHKLQLVTAAPKILMTPNSSSKSSGTNRRKPLLSPTRRILFDKS